MGECYVYVWGGRAITIQNKIVIVIRISPRIRETDTRKAATVTMAQNRLFSDAIEREAIKARANAHHHNCLPGKDIALKTT